MLKSSFMEPLWVCEQAHPPFVKRCFLGASPVALHLFLWGWGGFAPLPGNGPKTSPCKTLLTNAILRRKPHPTLFNMTRSKLFDQMFSVSTGLPGGVVRGSRP